MSTRGSIFLEIGNNQVNTFFCCAAASNGRNWRQGDKKNVLAELQQITVGLPKGCLTQPSYQPFSRFLDFNYGKVIKMQKEPRRGHRKVFQLSITIKSASCFNLEQFAIYISRSVACVPHGLLVRDPSCLPNDPEMIKATAAANMGTDGRTRRTEH